MGRFLFRPLCFLGITCARLLLGPVCRFQKGHRFGLHNLRHSLSNWMVNKAKVEAKTVQEILRHRRIQTTLDLDTQQDSDQTRAAQGQFLEALRRPTAMVQ